MTGRQARCIIAADKDAREYLSAENALWWADWNAKFDAQMTAFEDSIERSKASQGEGRP